MGINLQVRDKKLLLLCYEHGFLSRHHIVRLFPSRDKAYQRTRELASAGFIRALPSPINQDEMIFRLTPRGLYAVESGYPYRIEQRRQLSPALFSHSSHVLSTRLRCEELWTGRWIPECRLLRADREIPDGIFVFPSGKEVFVELENSIKSRKRFLRRLITFLSPSFVLYVATNLEIDAAIRRYLRMDPNLPPAGVLLLSDLLATPPPPVTTAFGRRSLFDRREIE